jgi:hypothetical protein
VIRRCRRPRAGRRRRSIMRANPEKCVFIRPPPHSIAISRLQRHRCNALPRRGPFAASRLRPFRKRSAGDSIKCVPQGDFLHRNENRTWTRAAGDVTWRFTACYRLRSPAEFVAAKAKHLAPRAGNQTHVASIGFHCTSGNKLGRQMEAAGIRKVLCRAKRPDLVKMRLPSRLGNWTHCGADVS